MDKSLVDLNSSDGSVSICFFLDELDAMGFDLSLEKVRLIPVGKCKTGRCHDRASVLDNVVLYYA